MPKQKGCLHCLVHKSLEMKRISCEGQTPARLSSFQYLNFVGCPARLFNAGTRRRTAGLARTGANFFDASNTNAAAQREEIAMETLEVRDNTLEHTHICICVYVYMYVCIYIHIYIHIYIYIYIPTHTHISIYF